MNVEGALGRLIEQTMAKKWRSASVSQLMRRTGLSRTTIYNVLEGRKAAGPDTLARIATALGVPADHLLDAQNEDRKRHVRARVSAVEVDTGVWAGFDRDLAHITAGMSPAKREELRRTLAAFAEAQAAVVSGPHETGHAEEEDEGDIAQGRAAPLSAH